MQCSTGQHRTGQGSTVQCSAVQCSTGQDRTGQGSAMQCSAVQYRAGQGRVGQCSTVQGRAAFKCLPYCSTGDSTNTIKRVSWRYCACSTANCAGNTVDPVSIAVDLIWLESVCVIIGTSRPLGIGLFHCTLLPRATLIPRSPSFLAFKEEDMRIPSIKDVGCAI